MNRGYVKVWRKIEDSGLIQLPNTLALFMYILLNATHKDTKRGTSTGVVELKRGQFISGIHKLSQTLEQSERQIRTSIDRLVKLGIIKVETTNRYSIYTIENYAIYQDNDTQIDKQKTNNRQANDKGTTTKQECKNLSIEELKPDYVPSELWSDFIHVRKELKASNSEKAIKALVTELTRLKDLGNDPVAVISQSIRSSWKDVYPLKAVTPFKASGVSTAMDDQTLVAKARELGIDTYKQSKADLVSKINKRLGVV